ncbi:MAG: GNAT family N-acetyltransferase [Chloroflexi bacterium]|nr:GNAT family N-acetyltransferase [Chloroflexota bacterium]
MIQHEPLAIRQATEADAAQVRLVVTRALIALGFDAPDHERDPDLADVRYYMQPGRGIWVATLSDGTVVGCAALDRGDGELALLRRLAGRGMRALTRSAIAFAQGRGYRGIETVLPATMSGAREAVEQEGFAPPGRHNDLLLRRAL